MSFENNVDIYDARVPDKHSNSVTTLGVFSSLDNAYAAIRRYARKIQIELDLEDEEVIELIQSAYILRHVLDKDINEAVA